ncbi:DUF418 domain-containing protein [Corynebacterium lizhenjunii]|uniref:DUF418 domain-containing protein n=1 Tax=Corynebacterium lizhenjunii TaxID=2709394 RepID=A0A7T0KEZ9_9CORY|nr:DUF418 domain-containing protein [Corynebacterium lizhenjunii]QPK78834.1 DUF418 domain-containing protein [Corynebacterium lizhenjunii]
MHIENRIHGIDLARGLAIIGMVYVHLGRYDFPGSQIFSGYASALFATLAGVSVALMMSRAEDLRLARYRLVLRGVIIMAIGVVLSAIQMPVVVVLTAIAWILMLLGPVAGWRLRNLFLLEGALVFGGPALVLLVHTLGYGSDLLDGTYPLLAWLAYGTAGIIIHRTLLDNHRRQALVAVVGFALVAGTYPWRYDHTVDLPYVSLMPHSGGVGDVVCSIAWSAAVVSVCLLVATPDWSSQLLYPLRALGSMALSIYIVHVITAGWLLGGVAPGLDSAGEETYSEGPMPWEDYQSAVAEAKGFDELYEAENQWWEKHQGPVDPGAIDEPSTNWAFWATVLGGMFFATAWKTKFRRGPAEAAIAKVLAKA